MFRKAFATSLAFILSVGIMCGCSNSNSPSQGAASSAKPSTGGTSGQGQFTPSYPIADKKITVKGAVVGNNIDMSEPRLAWRRLEEVTNIHVEFEAVTEDALAVYLASDNWPDFFHNALDSTYINDYGITGGRFINYNDYLQYMPNLQKTYQDYKDARKVVTETNGAVYTLPLIGNACTSVTARMYYREDTLKAAGCKVPTTVNEFHDVLVKLKDYNHGAAPLAEDREEFLWAPFGKGKNPDFEDDGTGKVVYNRVSDQYKLYLKYMNQLYSEGLLHKEYLTLDDATKLSLAHEGLITFGNTGIGNLAEDGFKSGKVELNQLAPLTSQYDDTRTVMGWHYCAPGGATINAKSQYVTELCKMFDVLYSTKEVVPGSGLDGTTFQYGPEGTTWEWANSDHTEYKLILPKELEGVKAFQEYVWDGIIYSDNLGRFDEFAHATTATPGNDRSRQQGFVKNLLPYQEKEIFPGDYLKFTKEEQEVIDNDYTTISNYIKEMKGKFITGIANVDTDWDDYVSKVNGMGLKEVLKAYQSAYNRWNA